MGLLKETMLLFAIGSVVTGIVYPAPANACSYSQIPEPVGDTSAQFLAGKMVAAATYVDVALVEDDGERSQREVATGIIVLRTVARLKGNSPDRFTLFGQPLSLSSNAQEILGRPLQHWTTDDGRVVPHDYSQERIYLPEPSASGQPPPPPPPMTSCSPPAISAKTGRLFIVMRDSEGRLLSRAIYHPGTARPDGPVYGFVSLKGDEIDHWTRAVLQKTYRSPNALGEPMRSDGTAEPGYAMIMPKPGTNPATIAATLKELKIQPIAAVVRSGTWYDDIRPVVAREQNWLAKAFQTVAARNKLALGDPHRSFAEWYLYRNKRGSQLEGLDIRIAKAVVDSVYHRQKMADQPMQLYSVEVAGTPSALAKLETNNLIGQLRTAARGLDGKLAIVMPISARQGLPELDGDTDVLRFEAQQELERQIWQLNESGGYTTGTLP